MCTSEPGTAIQRTDQMSSTEILRPDAEHQQDDADLGELQRELGIADEARRVGADGEAGEQVADDRGKPQPLGDEAEDEGEHDRGHQGRDQRVLAFHLASAACVVFLNAYRFAVTQARNKSAQSLLTGPADNAPRRRVLS